MNNSTLIFLLNENVRAVMCSYEPLNGKRPEEFTPLAADAKGLYTFKTLDPTIEVGDLVVVPTDTRHGHTVVRVEEVDVDIDLESSINLKWIIDKVDLTASKEVLEQEARAITAVSDAEKRRKRRELKESILTAMDEKANEEILSLTLASAPETEPSEKE